MSGLHYPNLALNILTYINDYDDVINVKAAIPIAFSDPSMRQHLKRMLAARENTKARFEDLTKPEPVFRVAVAKRSWVKSVRRHKNEQ